MVTLVISKVSCGTICDRIVENHPYGSILHIKYLALKSSLIILLFVHLRCQYSKSALNYKKNVEICKYVFVMSAAQW